MINSYRYKAFISYAHEDKEIAKWLHKKIEHYRIPKSLRASYPHIPMSLERSVFIDKEELSSGVLEERLKEALGASEKLVLIASKSAMCSTWVEEEIAYFIKVRGREDIHIVVKEGLPSQVIPKVLYFENNAEPLAIELKEGRNVALFKLLATLLDVPFATLWQREKRAQKVRRVSWGMGVLVFVSVLGYALWQSSAIDSNAALMHIEQQVASLEYRLKHHKLSNDDVMQVHERLEDLAKQKKQKVETLKWFGLLQSSVAKQAQHAYNTKGVDEALAILESSKSKVEDTHYAQKNMLRAKQYIEKHAYMRADVYYRKALMVDDSYMNVYDYALFLSKQNRVKDAKPLYEKLCTYDLIPEERANVLNRLGIVYRKLKRYDEAKDAYAKALDIRKVLSANDAMQYQNDLAWTYNNIGVLNEEINATTQAIEAHTTALALRRELQKLQPKKYRYFISCSKHNLGELYLHSKALDKAETLLRASVQIRRALYVQNPRKYRVALTATLTQLAGVYSEKGALDKAGTFYEEAEALARVLVAQNTEAYGRFLADVLKGKKLLKKRKAEQDAT